MRRLSSCVFEVVSGLRIYFFKDGIIGIRVAEDCMLALADLMGARQVVFFLFGSPSLPWSGLLGPGGQKGRNEALYLEGKLLFFWW